MPAKKQFETIDEYIRRIRRMSKLFWKKSDRQSREPHQTPKKRSAIRYRPSN